MRALPITLLKRFIPQNAVTTGDEAPIRIRAYKGNVSMRFILRCLMAASCILVFLGAAQAQSVTIGDTAVLSSADGQNGNLLAAQSATLAKTATIESLSFYVTAANGNLILGIYDATGPNGGPGALKASTASFTPATGWNTAKVVTPVSLTAGAYWLAYLPSSNGLGFVKTNTSGNCAYYSYNFGSSLPSKFSTSPASCTPTTWSFYATLTASSSGTTTTSSGGGGNSTGGNAVNGACGSSNAADLTSTPTTNLCSAGMASSVGGSGPWTWTCAGSGGGTTASCSALLETNGACGSANGGTVSTKPTANLCTAGTASTVSGSGPWSWTCAGSNGGATASCSDKLASTTGTTGSSGSTGTTGSDPTSGVLPSYNDAYANWENAGLQSVGGIPNRTTICATVNPLGGGKDDFTDIQNAINNCPAGEVVQLGAGAFTVHMADLPIQISTGIVLRGTGSCSGSSSPYCSSSISVTDGLQPYQPNGPQCGTSTSSESSCPNGGPPIVLIAPVSPDYNYSWAQCGNVGFASGLSCGAAPLAADAAQGQSTIQVSSTSSFSVGMWVLIDEASGAGWVADPLSQWTGYGSVWAAPDWLSSSGSPATGRVLWPKAQGGGGWDFGSTLPSQTGSQGCWFTYCDRPTSELHKIASIGAGPCPGTKCTLTFDDPLTIAFRQSGGHAAQVYGPLYPSNSVFTSPISFLQNAGLENVSLLRGPNGGLEMEFCAYCWVKNVEVGDWYNGGISIEYSVRSEFNTVYVHHCWDSVNGGGEYPIDLKSASTEILITNSITNFAGKGMTARAGGAGSVVSYSYMDDTMYDDYSGIGDYWLDMGVNASHYTGQHHVLFEGNWGDNLDNDNTHGNSMYITFFRNQGSGLRTPFTDPSLNKAVNDYEGIGYNCGTSGPTGCSSQAPGPLRAAGPMAYNYWFGFVGNVLGTPMETTSANGWTYQGDWSENRMWMLGWNAGPGGEDPKLDGATGSYIFRHGDYDYVNGSIADWTSGYSHTLPNSFYASSQPSFFGASGTKCTYSWPWITPTGSTPIQSPSGTGCASKDGLPAKARWDAGTPFVQP
jgi:hypothetical protein